MTKQTPIDEIKAPPVEEGNDGDEWASEEDANEWHKIFMSLPIYHPELAPDVPSGKAVLHTQQV